MPVQVIVVVVAVVVVLLTGVGGILVADRVRTLVRVILENAIGTSIVHTHAARCHLDGVTLATGTTLVRPDA